MRPQKNRLDWSGAGYFGFPVTRDRADYISPDDAALWRDFEAVLAPAKQGRFDDIESLIDLYDETDSWILAGAYCDLLGDAGSGSCFERLIPVVGSVAEPTYAVELGEALGSWGSLSVVPTLLIALEGLAGFDDAEILPEILSRMLESEPGPIADPGGLEDFESYRARVSRRHAELEVDLGSPETIVLHGEVFDVGKLAKRMSKALAEDKFEPYLRRKFEATTGIDCSGFYVDGALRPLPAAAVLEAFLDSPDTARYQPGVRYFFGHALPL